MFTLIALTIIAAITAIFFSGSEETNNHDLIRQDEVGTLLGIAVLWASSVCYQVARLILWLPVAVLKYFQILFTRYLKDLRLQQATSVAAAVAMSSDKSGYEIRKEAHAEGITYLRETSLAVAWWRSSHASWVLRLGILLAASAVLWFCADTTGMLATTLPATTKKAAESIREGLSTHKLTELKDKLAKEQITTPGAQDTEGRRKGERLTSVRSFVRGLVILLIIIIGATMIDHSNVAALAAVPVACQPPNSNLSKHGEEAGFFSLAAEVSGGEFNEVRYRTFKTREPEEKADHITVTNNLVDAFTSEHSFAIVRDDEVRVIDLLKVERDEDDEIESTDLVFGARENYRAYLDVMGIKLDLEKEGQQFKAGKYLGRLMKPFRNSGWFMDVEIMVNTAMVEKYGVEATDGASLIHVDWARQVYSDVKVGQRLGITVGTSHGLIKGHAFVVDDIDHDLVIYGEENIKGSVKLTHEAVFLGVNASFKLGRRFLLDIQSIINMQEVFGLQQYFDWALYTLEKLEYAAKTGEGMEEIVPSLGAASPEHGALSEDYAEESWSLKRAYTLGIEVWKHPVLVRRFMNLVKKMLMSRKSKFRIMVPGGKAGYLFPDFRTHDGDGNFTPRVKRGELEIDEHGNLWIHPEDAAEFCDIHGGADMDDRFELVPVGENKCVVLRRPNQYGEVSVWTVRSETVELEHKHQLETTEEIVNHTTGELPERVERDVEETEEEDEEPKQEPFNPFANRSISKETAQEIPYTPARLAEIASDRESGGAAIGMTANSEMFVGGLGIQKPRAAEVLRKKFPYNYEGIIDGGTKDGAVSEDFQTVEALIRHLFEAGFVKVEQQEVDIELPACLSDRVPKKYREHFDVLKAEQHPLDFFVEEYEKRIKQLHLDIVGDGHVLHGRTEGWIDRIETDGLDFAKGGFSTVVRTAGESISSLYADHISEVLEKAEEMQEDEEITDKEVEDFRKEGLQEAQDKVVLALADFTPEQAEDIVRYVASKRYTSKFKVHSSILWIRDLETKQGFLPGTTTYMIRILQDMGKADRLSTDFGRYDLESMDDVENVRTNHKGVAAYTRKNEREEADFNAVRIWSTKAERESLAEQGVIEEAKKLDAEAFEGVTTVHFEDGQAFIEFGEDLIELHVDAEIEGEFEVVRFTHARKQDNGDFMPSSVMAYLK